MGREVKGEVKTNLGKCLNITDRLKNIPILTILESICYIRSLKLFLDLSNMNHWIYSIYS